MSVDVVDLMRRRNAACDELDALHDRATDDWMERRFDVLERMAAWVLAMRDARLNSPRERIAIAHLCDLADELEALR